jgi:Domain of unknown function (DUF4301)
MQQSSRVTKSEAAEARGRGTNGKIAPMNTFSAADLRQLAAAGITVEKALRQLELLAHPPPPIRLARPCRIDDGIATIPPEREAGLLERAAAAQQAGRCMAMIPASGAASRMFEAALGCLHGDKVSDRALESAAAAGDAAAAATLLLLRELLRLPFVEELERCLATDGKRVHDLRAAGANRALLEALLLPCGLDYANTPKGLLPFHRYRDGARSAFEEHLRESALSVAVPGGTARVHFTVSREHQESFVARWRAQRQRLTRAYGVEFEVTFSSQDSATDTIAVDLDNLPFRLADDSLLLRPGGHGALLRNLQGVADGGGDLLLLKNVDNIVPDSGRALVVKWRMLLLGALLELEAEVRFWQRRSTEDAAGLAGAARFLAERFGVRDPPGSGASSHTVGERLRRPLRVCGMVRNQGHAGGGPFWASDNAGQVTRQIVEASQVSPDTAQRAILAASTHFNPVDVVCSLRDVDGAPYDLSRYVDPAAVFLAEKSAAGRKLKALEWPGLWNGAMSGWNTLFVEVPAATFAPVKTVLDLLGAEHQAG